MVKVRAAAAVALAMLAASSGSAQKSAPPSVDLVEIDVVVTDRSGQHVPGLKREDFEVKEDGDVVDIKTFTAVSSGGSTQLDDARSVVILLDDMSMSPMAENSIKALANYVAAFAGDGDEFSVMRLTNRNDEPYGDFESAVGRIAEYQPSPVPFDGLQATEDVLTAVTTVARRFQDGGRRRKVLVCIGTSQVCNVLEPRRWALRSMWRKWTEAVSAAALANVSVYALVSRRGGPSAGGIVDATGGELFGSSSDLRPAVRRIWEDASRHYLLGYWPSGASKDLHSIQVKVAGKGRHVLARRVRGN